MAALTPKRKINLTGLEVSKTQPAPVKLANSPQTVNSSHGTHREVPQQSLQTIKPSISRALPVQSLKLVAFVPMNQTTVTATKTSVTTLPTSGSSEGTPQRKFRYANLNTNNLRRPPIHPDISVTSSVSTQTNSSYLEKNVLKQQQQQGSANNTELFAVCRWCGTLSKNFLICDGCRRTLDQNSKTYSPQAVRVSKPSQDTTVSPTIATLIPQATIVITSQGSEGTTLLTTPTVIKAGQFYGQQVSVHSPVAAARLLPQPVNGTSKVLVMEGKTTPVRKYRGKKKVEPECLTISSDEDESHTSRATPAPVENINTSLSKENATGSEDGTVNRTSVIQTPTKKDSSDCGTVTSPAWPLVPSSGTGDMPPDEEHISIKCRSIRIGSYKVQAYDPQALTVTVTLKEIRFTVTCIEGVRIANVSIQKEDIPSVLAHFGKVLPVLFIYTTPACATTIRSLLSMTEKDKPYYDPCNSEECTKRITILPYSLSDDQKIFLSHKFPGSLLTEIKQAVANEILIRSTPVQYPQYFGINIQRPETRSQLVITQTQKPQKEVVKLVTYPPPPQTGGIEVNSEDLECLNEGEFLNDVIIDFYVKYLVNERLSLAHKQQTHIFSSFFFPRLTTKNTDEELTLNLSRRRHARVKTWTRHVDIFEKDFIIVPINQNSHWFLAVICFPGMMPQDVDKTFKSEEGDKTLDMPEEECEPSPSQDNMTDNLMETDDQESPLPAPATPATPACPMTVPLPGLEDGEKPKPTFRAPSPSTDITDKGPCILIFDSLPGNHRWKIVQILREYLTIEYETRKKEKRIFDRNTMRGMNVTLLPRQENYTDCGIFLLQYVESFFEKPLKKFSSPLPSLLDWFPDSKIASKRQELKDLIIALQKQQLQIKQENK